MKALTGTLRALGFAYYIRAAVVTIGMLLSAQLFFYAWAVYWGTGYLPYTPEGWAVFLERFGLMSFSFGLFWGLALIALLSILEGKCIRQLMAYNFCKTATIAQACLSILIAFFLIVLVSRSNWLTLSGFLFLVGLSILEIRTFIFLSGSSVRTEFQRMRACRSVRQESGR